MSTAAQRNSKLIVVMTNSKIPDETTNSVKRRLVITVLYLFVNLSVIITLNVTPSSDDSVPNVASELLFAIKLANCENDFVSGAAVVVLDRRMS